MSGDRIADLGEEEVLRRMRGWALRKAGQMLPESEVQDAAQRATLEVWRAMARLDGVRDPWALLTVVARRAVWKHAREVARRRECEAFYGLQSDEDGGLPDPDVARLVGPEEALETSYAVARVREAVAALPAAERRAVTMIDLDGLRPMEANAILGLSPQAGALRQARARGHARLRASLADLQEAA